jgi:hypothetical protein
MLFCFFWWERHLAAIIEVGSLSHNKGNASTRRLRNKPKIKARELSPSEAYPP